MQRRGYFIDDFIANEDSKHKTDNQVEQLNHASASWMSLCLAIPSCKSNVASIISLSFARSIFPSVVMDWINASTFVAKSCDASRGTVAGTFNGPIIKTPFFSTVLPA